MRNIRKDKDEDEMLKALGLKDAGDLFSDIPDEIRCELDLPMGMEEIELMRELKSVLGKNRSSEEIGAFLGAGIYNHFIPSAVGAVVSRSEFYTSYTPYQSEVSQGILQALFEYQSLMCELTGMDAANTSMYDGSTALGEACMMAQRINGGREVIVPKALSRERKSVLSNYCIGPDIGIKEVGFDQRTGRLDLSHLKELVKDETSAVYIENPNFFGVLEEDFEQVRTISEGKVLIVGVNPLSLAVLKPPGEMGADIVVGEGQPLGLEMNYGGPLLGMFACKQEHIRKMPGRVVGLTNDMNGRRAFCLTLQAREQHIRRDKAMSNICTNESLCALASAAHISLLGGNGLQRLALKNMRMARELANRINELDGFKAPLFNSNHFNEFVVRSDTEPSKINARLLEHSIQGGLPLKDHFPELGNASLFAVTELMRSEDIEALVNALEVLR